MRDRAAPWLITHQGGKKAASGEAWGKNLGVARKMTEGILMRNNLCYNREAVVWRAAITLPQATPLESGPLQGFLMRLRAAGFNQPIIRPAD